MSLISEQKKYGIELKKYSKMRRVVFSVIFTTASFCATAQSYFTVTWKGELGSKEVPIDSVQVTNLTKDWTTTVFYPENSIKLHYADSVKIKESDFANKQIRVIPNPFSQTAEVSFYVRKEGLVNLTLYDIFERTVASFSQNMEYGMQQVLVNLGSSGYYFLSIETPTERRVAKLLSMGYGNSGEAGIMCRGSVSGSEQNPNTHISDPLNMQTPKIQKSDGEYPPFDIGDSLQFVAFATDSNGNFIEYPPQSECVLADKKLLFIICDTIFTTDYTLGVGCGWNFPNIVPDSLYIINSDDELLTLIFCSEDSMFTDIDFNKYTLLFAHGGTSPNVPNITKKLEFCSNNYKLDIDICLNESGIIPKWHTAIIVHKLENVKIKLIRNTYMEQPCNCILDTLIGDWAWYRTYGGFAGSSKVNVFKSVIKILSQNADSSINYEVRVRDTLFIDALFPNIYDHSGIFVEDTLFSKGSFQIQEGKWNYRRVVIKLPHYIFDYYFYFYAENILTFWDRAMDGYFYYYQKIK